MKKPLVLAFAVLAAGATLAACGGSTGPLPGTKSVGDVQKAGLSQSAVGRNKCDPKSASRPFVIEWDATDMSSFESRAANDVVFVRYEGCDLQVVDGCTQDSERGSFGSYKPVEWTSGSVESLDINNEGDLYAKLPLGSIELGGRVEGGEKFHMEYFVSGTRTATRDAVHRGDLASVPACKNATHFVYAYNLGAFALGSQSNIKGSITGTSIWGYGGGADRSSQSKAEKAGGVLASCRGETAKDVATCRVPIRLTLREVSGGDNADVAEAQAPETPEAKNLAGKLAARTDKEHKAQEHAQAAQMKLNSKDGKGCVAELDQHDKLDPRPEGLSTNTGNAYALIRGQCLMLAGKCAPGKVLYRQALEKTSSSTLMGPEQLDKATENVASMNCQGGSMSPRDQLLKALMAINLGANLNKSTVADCQQNIETARRLVPTVKVQDEDDNQLKQANTTISYQGPACIAKAGDCTLAYKTFKDLFKLRPNMTPEIMGRYTEDTYRQVFEVSIARCKGK